VLIEQLVGGGGAGGGARGAVEDAQVDGMAVGAAGGVDPRYRQLEAADEVRVIAGEIAAQRRDRADLDRIFGKDHAWQGRTAGQNARRAHGAATTCDAKAAL